MFFTCFVYINHKVSDLISKLQSYKHHYPIWQCFPVLITLKVLLCITQYILGKYINQSQILRIVLEHHVCTLKLPTWHRILNISKYVNRYKAAQARKMQASLWTQTHTCIHLVMVCIRIKQWDTQWHIVRSLFSG